MYYVNRSREFNEIDFCLFLIFYSLFSNTHFPLTICHTHAALSHDVNECCALVFYFSMLLYMLDTFLICVLVRPSESTAILNDAERILYDLFLFFSIYSFISVFCAFWTGLSGCWRRSAGAITATAILMLLTCLLAAGAMGLWHTVEFFEKEKVVGEEFYQQWTNVLRDNTRISYDWSYVLAWAGVASSLIAAILLSGAAVCLRSEREKEEQLNLQYLMPGNNCQS